MRPNYVCMLVVFSLAISLGSKAENTASVRGGVEDPSGTATTGVEVTLTPAAGGQPLVTRTDDEGEFEFSNVPAGQYVLQVKLRGFKQAEVPVTVGRTSSSPLRVRLAVAGVTEKVTVAAGAQPVALAEENNNALHLSQELLSNLPTKNGDPLDVPSLFLNPAVLGATGPKIILDGVETDSLDMPSASVKSVRVDASPYSAEFGRPGKGRLEIKTRRGRHNRYRGVVLAMLRNSALDARNAFAAVRPLQQRGIGEAELDGPISKNLTFFVAGRYFTFNNTSLINALTPSGPFVRDSKTPERDVRLFGRLDYHLNPVHKVIVSYKFKNRSFDQVGISGFSLPERGTDIFNHGNEVKILETAIPSPNVLNHLRLYYKQEREDTTSITKAPAIIVLGAFSSGGAQVLRRLNERRGDIEDVATVFYGRHMFRFGGGIRPGFFYAEDASNFDGTFTFSSLLGYEQGLPILFTINVGSPTIFFQKHEYFSFAQDDVHLRPNLSLMLGLRHEFQSNVPYYRSLGPRLAFAYSPGGGATVLRGGFGVFDDREPAFMEQQSLLYNGVAIHQIVISNPSFPNPFGPGETANLATASMVRIAPGIRFPYLMQGSMAVDRRLGRGQNFLSLELTAVRGVELYRTRNINAPLPGSRVRPDPDFININQYEASGTSRGASAAVTYRGHLRKANLIAQYTLARTLDDTSSPNSLPANNYDLRSEWGRADFDQRHRFNLVGIYALPRGFQLSGVVNVWSGPPYNITTGFDNNGDTVPNDRPPGLWRNAARGPGTTNVDARLSKRWGLQKREHAPTIEWAIDAFNVLNQVNFKTYVGTMTSPFFGRANAALAARQLQLSLRFNF